jgi:hypothetical protein
MQSEYNRMLANIEQIIITLIEENRYSCQLVRSTITLSNEISVELDKLDYSVGSLQLIDDYFNNAPETKKIDIEICVSVTIYLSQVLILSCNGIWLIEHKLFSLHDEVLETEELWFYSLWIATYNTGFVTRPHHIFINNIATNKSEIKKTAFLRISEIKSYKPKNNYDNRYNLCGLDNFTKEGYDFYSDTALLISHLSIISGIPEKKLNKSVNSLKLIDEFVRNDGRDILIDVDEFDEKTFLSLIVYVGEVIIKAVDGEWKLSVEKFRTGSVLSYHWTVKIFNSKGEELKAFIRNICDNLSRHTYDGCRIKRIVELYIHANQQESFNKIEHVWRDTKPYPKKRIWRNELNI